MQRDIEEYEDHELMAYADGQLNPEEAARVEDRLASDPEAAAIVQAMLEQKLLIQEAADDLEPATTDLRTAALERKLADRLAQRLPGGAPGPRFGVPGWLRQAAAALVLVSAGWFAHGEYQARFMDSAEQMPIYVAQAVGAHSVYANDGFRPVEFSADDTDMAIRWASAQIGEELSVPSLDALGLELVGSRLLGTAAGPILYLIYEDAAQNRLSVLVARHPPDEPQYEFRLASMSDNTVGYWSHGALDYALVARTSEAQIAAIAGEISASLASM